MNNDSRNYGPIQVQDLSEFWSETGEKTQGNRYDTSSASYPIKTWLSGMSANVLSVEYSLQSTTPTVQSKSITRMSPGESERTPVQDEWKPSVTWIGALLRSVRGSIPSSTTWSVASAPIYKLKKLSGQTQPLIERNVDNLDYNNGS